MYEKIKKYFEKESGKNDEKRAKEIHQVVIKYQSILYKCLIEYYPYYYAEFIGYLQKKILILENTIHKIYELPKDPQRIKLIQKMNKDEIDQIPIYEERINEMINLDSKELFEKISNVPYIKKTLMDEDKFLEILKRLLNIDFNLSDDTNIDGCKGIIDPEKILFYLFALYIFFDTIWHDDSYCKIDEIKFLKLTISINYLIKCSTGFRYVFDTSGKISDRILKSKIPRRKASKYKQIILEKYILIADRDNLSDLRIGQILAAKLKKQFPDNEKLHSKEKIPSVKTIIRWLKAEGLRQK